MIRNARHSLNAVTRRIAPATPRHATSSATSTTSPNSKTRSAPAPPRATPKYSKDDPRPRTKRHEHHSKDSSSRDPPSKPLLKPYRLSERLSKLCEANKLEEALETLKNMPLDAQNSAVWGTVISQAGEAGRFQLAYQLYVDMKRRGVKPDCRTYVTLMSAFQKVLSWEGRGKLLQNVHTTYANYLEYTQRVKAHNPDSPELTVVPINAYLAVLKNSQQWQRLFDVYNELDDEGPLSPDCYTYTTMFRSLYARGSAADDNSPTGRTERESAASGARLVLRDLQKRLQTSTRITLDPYAIGAIIQVLALGRPADQIAAFDVLRDHVGLSKPGESSPAPTVELTPPLLSDALWLCNVAKKPRLCVHFAHQVMARDPTLLDRGHMDHVLAAYGSLAALGSLSEAAHALQTLEWMLEQEQTAPIGHRIRPGPSTYTLVLVACWRAKDWDSALRAFELMTGFAASDFADGASASASGSTSAPQPATRSHGRNLEPDAAAASCLVRTALAAGDPAALRQCARIAVRLDVARVFGTGAPAEPEPQRGAPRFRKDASFYAHKTAGALVELVDALVPRASGQKRSVEEREWAALRSAARAFLTEQRHRRPKDTPELEEQPLGSEAGLAAMDDAVSWDRISRDSRIKA